MEKNKWTVIQLFRIAAAIGVFLFHFGSKMKWGGILYSFSDFGQYGVRMFFIISGLLAARGLDSAKDIKSYYKKRFVRIAPLYYIVILWYFITDNVLNLFLGQIPADTIGIGWFRYFFMLNGFLPFDTYYWSNIGFTWTIPVFVFFYLIAPFIMRWVKNEKSAFLALLIAFGTTRFAELYYSCTILLYLYQFFIGILIYYCWKNKKLMACALGFLLVAIAESVLNLRFYPAVFASMICIGLQLEVNLPMRVQKIVNIIDEHTYTLYLFHGVVLHSFLDMLLENGVTIPTQVVGSIAFVLIIVGTLVIYRWVEKPVQGLLRNKLFPSA